MRTPSKEERMNVGWVLFDGGTNTLSSELRNNKNNNKKHLQKFRAMTPTTTTTRSLLVTSTQRNKDKDEWRRVISRDGGYRPFWTSRFMCIWIAMRTGVSRAGPARGPRPPGTGAEGTSHTDSTIMVSWVCIIIDRPWCDWWLSGTPATIEEMKNVKV